MPRGGGDSGLQGRGFRAAASFRLGVGICDPVQAHWSVTPQRGHSNLAAAPSSALGIQRSIFVWQPGV